MLIEKNSCGKGNLLRIPSNKYRILALIFFLCLGPLRCICQEINWEDELPPDWSSEPNSPEELIPATIEPGLDLRAVPLLPPPELPEPISPFYRLQKISRIQDIRRREISEEPDPSAFRPSTTYLPPIGLHPRFFRMGLLEIYPSFGVAQSYESNVNLAPFDPIADFYITPRLALEWQIGSPDSAYNSYYDTILALHGSYEAWADLFYEHPEFSAFNQEIQLFGRIGRSAAIWRPAFSFSEITGSNLLMSELVNRTERLRINADLPGQYQFTEHLGMNQNFGFFQLNHPDSGYINYSVWRTRQEITWKIFNEVRSTIWGEYRYSTPDQGFSGDEIIAGVGFYGKFDPRLYSELRVGWDFLNMRGVVPGRKNLSGIRFNGWTTFDWSPRLRLTLRYDREYVLNEVDENDNYVSTLLQARSEIFLGGNWYITPYFGCSLQEFETSGRLYIQLRPELEIAYALPGPYYGADSRLFVKGAYMSSTSLKGPGDPIVNWRFSMGLNCKF